MNIEYNIFTALDLVNHFQKYSIPTLYITETSLIDIHTSTNEIKFLAIEQLDKVQLIFQSKLGLEQEQLICDIRKEICANIQI